MVEIQFVAREKEISRLNALLESTLVGQSKICFITGDAGSGKTALVEEFTRRAQLTYPDLLVAVGKCNAQTGLGDPYLPFREVLSLLFGDVEEKLAQNAISTENANRLQDFLNHSGGVLVEMTPHLIGALIPGTKLLATLGKAVAKEFGWIDDLKHLIQHQEEKASQLAVNQQHIFEEYAKALTALAERKPLIIVLDDLQWADAASISLLFHLGRKMIQSRVLFIGCYRPADVELRRGL